MARHGRSYPLQARIVTPPRSSPPEIVNAVVTSTIGFANTSVQSEVIAYDTTTALLANSTLLQSGILGHPVSTAISLTTIPAISLSTQSSIDSYSSIPKIGASILSGIDFSSDIDQSSISMTEQPSMTEVSNSFIDIVNALQQGGQPPPTVVREYLTTEPHLVADKPYRLIAQRILDREFIDWDLPISDVVITYVLSGPKVIRGKLKPEIIDFLDLGLEPKATYIHVEQDGIIRGSAILQPGEINDDASLTFIAEGISGYAHGQPFQGEYSQINVDPLDVVRTIWTHLLAFPRANLGLTIASAASPKLLGTEVDESTGSISPYSLFWWDDVDCGREIDELAKSTPFDYLEFDCWNPEKTDVLHYVIPYYPRAGNRRTDIAFVAGENVVSVALLREEPDQYASEVIVRGAGEGPASIRGYAANIIGNRIKQSVVVTDKTITTQDAANTRARNELRRRQAFLKIREITILDKHDNASLGDFSPGDDIMVQVELYWFGEVSMWCRVIGYDWSPENRLIAVQLDNSESFDYGATI